MKTIQVTVDDQAWQAAERAARAQATTVDEWLRQQIAELAQQAQSADDDTEARRREAVRHLLELSARSTAAVGPITWKRDDLHER